MSDDDETRPLRVAVIAVHGIANHAAGETARAVADLLLKQRASKATYGPYDKTDVRIATRPMAVASPAAGAPPRPSRFDERSSYVRAMQAAPRSKPAVAALDEDQNGFGFMRDQLLEYRPTGSDAVYETERLRTVRREAGKPELEVHVYEMYWANLSRLGRGILRVFGELYQLLLHLASVGRQTANFAALEHHNDSSHLSWAWFDFLVLWSVRLLTLPIPILNLFLLAAVFMPVPGQLFGQWSGPVALVVLGLFGAFAAVWFLLRFERVAWPAWLLMPPASATATAVLGTLLIQPGTRRAVSISPYQLLAIEWCAVAAVLIALAVGVYDRRRPGAKTVALWIGLGLAAFGVVPQLLLARDSQAAIFAAALKIVEVLFLCLVACWIPLLIAVLLTFLAGCFALWKSRGLEGRLWSRAVRAVQTSCLALSLPSLLFLVITLILYRALSQAGAYLFPEGLQYSPSWLLTSYTDIASPLPAVEFLNKLIAASATPAFLVALIMLAAALIMVVWALLPVVISDLKPPAKNTPRLARSMGNWLSSGYHLLVLAGATVFLAFPVALSLGLIVQVLNRRFHFLPDDNTPQVLGILGTVVVGSVGGLLAFHGRLESVALGFRPALDTILDIDNYLREHPRDANPRARICCRFVSLLEHLCNWRDPRDGGGYQGIILVAHSQGAVICAETLRFLQRFPDPSLARLSSSSLPVYLFTMGCPLRQLYGWRFPHLYPWARHDMATKWTIGDPAYIPADQKPDPAKLGVELWVNAYRSGDYIGRYLWRSDLCDYHWASPDGIPPVVSQDEKGLRREFCIGAGGHNHYFDDTAPEIAVELDRLIDHMANKAPFPSIPLLGVECREPQEEKLLNEIVDVSQKLLNRDERPVRRGQHPKQHGCLHAEFEVEQDLPAALRVGLFREPRKYDAVVRFSNGREMDDTHPDIHGMAVKILGVPGDKILDDERDATTQDFILIDHPVFFIRNLRDYAPFSWLLLNLKNSWRIWALIRLFCFFVARGQWRQFRILLKSRGKRIASPLDVRYWSTTPSRWGSTAAKYSAMPAGPSEENAVLSKDPNYLHEVLLRRLNQGPDVCFDFLVQRQSNPGKHPIEDPTVEWDTPWVKIATIRIPSQTFDEDEQKSRCENLAFTPWHSLPDHRPLGGINRSRKQIYSSLSKTRRMLNGVPYREP